MHKAYANLLFSAVVTAVMNGLDMLYHLSIGWAVHLNYVAIKITVIFLTVWLIAQLIGIGKEQGIVASIFGPAMFYIYYVFAGATLNRVEFKIDEQFWFIFLHIGCMLIAYFAAWYFVAGKEHKMRMLSFWATAAFTAIALFALAIMIQWRFEGVSEEDAARMMTFSLIIIPAMALALGVAAGIVIEQFSRKRYLDSAGAGVLAALGIGIFTWHWAYALYGLVIILITYYLIHTCKQGLAEAA